MAEIKKCPQCKSTRGFRMDYEITGYGHSIMGFNGIEFDSNRTVYDNLPTEVYCLDCEASIPIHLVKHE